MPRPPRFSMPGVPHHVIQRGNNRSALFAETSDYLFLLACLRRACERYGCRLHAYVLMTNHLHLLATPSTDDAVARVMQSVGVRYVQRFNKAHDRTGTLWEGRYRSTVVESERYLVACYRYIELNPVRAGLVTDPREYVWSSHNANAFGASDPMVTAHARYLELGADPAARQAAYRALFDVPLPDSTVNEIRFATNRRWTLGSEEFREEVATLVGRRTTPSRAGRRARWKDEIGV